MSSVIKSNYVIEGNKIGIGNNFNLSVLSEVEKCNGIDTDSILKDAEAKALETIRDAEEQAKIIVEKANSLASDINLEIEAHRNTINEQARMEYSAMIENAELESNDIITKAKVEKATILESISGDIEKTVIGLVGNLIDFELASSNRWVGYLVKRMLSSGGFDGELILRLNTEIYQGMSKEETDLIYNLKQDIRVITDTGLSRSACIIESGDCAIEYDIKDGLRDMLRDIETIHKF